MKTLESIDTWECTGHHLVFESTCRGMSDVGLVTVPYTGTAVMSTGHTEYDMA
jgi:hypothetical protein